MKVKYEKVCFNICGDIYCHYIKLIKNHWWNRWRIVMDGNIPMRFDENKNVII